ncbi:hypothetical protein [Pontibacter flavimaris]|uniref:Uncharacterized protein n=1 Tax=Pontibacter flavimaris TaxID=1797110 RepID=A0A1Q5PG49_9BACT|nr:hypothetical protein [Pontibacter flavimaris]OKL41163.1 hypothetical protein A3841_15185 [Pontibacter flavimaris]
MKKKKEKELKRNAGSVAAVQSQVAFARSATVLALVSVGAMAVGGLAIGHLAMKKLALKSGEVDSLRVNDPEVGRLKVKERITEHKV